MCLRHGPGGHEAAIAPAHDGQPVGVGHAHGNDLIDAGLNIFIVLAAPVVIVGEAERSSISAGAAWIRTQHSIAAGREHRYGIKPASADKTFVEDSGWTAMNIED